MIREAVREATYEEALVSSLIADPRGIDLVQGQVSERDFENPSLAKAYATIGAMIEAGDPIGDTVVMLKKLKNTGLSVSDIQMLVSSGVAAHATYYAKMVRSEAVRRRLQSKLAAVLDGLEVEGVDKTVNRLEDLLRDCQSAESCDFTTLTDAGLELLNEIESTKSGRPSCFSGIYSLDDKVGGFLPGELIIIAARPGVGKTSLAMQFAYHNASVGRAGLFVSLEMRKTELAGRVFCGLTEVDSKHLRRGTLSREEIDKIHVKILELAETKLFIWDPPSANINRIRSMAKLAKLRHDIQYIVVDYIGLVDADDRSKERREHISDVTRTLKQMAKDLECPVFALCQLNRDADGVEPKLSNLRDSGSVEQDADAVLFLHPLSAEDKSKVDMIVAKHRHGECGAFKLNFDEKATSFNDGNGVQWNV